MYAIIRHRNTGEHFLARLDESGNADLLSAALPTHEATDHNSGEIEWSTFENADLEPWDDPTEAWTTDQITIVHRFEN